MNTRVAVAPSPSSADSTSPMAPSTPLSTYAIALKPYTSWYWRS